MKAANLTETVSWKDVEAVGSALRSLREQLPFLVRLTLPERSLLPHLRRHELEVMNHALKAAKEHGGLIPRDLDLERFERDMLLFQELDRCHMELQRFASELRDTMRLLASDPLKVSTQIRAYVAVASKRVPALEELARRLTKTKPRRRRKRAPASPAPAPPGLPAPASPRRASAA